MSEHKLDMQSLDASLPKSIGGTPPWVKSEINSIDPEIVKLKNEVSKLLKEKAELNRKISDYESQIDEYKREMKIRKASDYEGKYFKDSNNNYIHIIEIGDKYPMGMCTVLNMEEKLITIKEIGLFTVSRPMLMIKETDRLIIDDYKPISQSEFRDAFFRIIDILEESI